MIKKLIYSVIMAIFCQITFAQNTTTVPTGTGTGTMTIQSRYKLITPDSLNQWWFYNPITVKWNRFFSATESNLRYGQLSQNNTWSGTNVFNNNVAIGTGFSFTVGNSTNGINVSTSAIKISNSGNTSEYDYNKIAFKNLPGGFEHDIIPTTSTTTANVKYSLPNKPSDDTFAMTSDFTVLSGYFLNSGGNTAAGNNTFTGANSFPNGTQEMLNLQVDHSLNVPQIQINGTGGLGYAGVLGMSANSSMNWSGTAFGGLYQNWTIQQISDNLGDLQFVNSHASTGSSITLTGTNGGDWRDISNNYFAKNTGDSRGIVNSNYSSFSQLGVGTGSTAITPRVQTIETSTATARGVWLDQYSSGTQSSRLHLRKGRGTFASPTTVITGDIVSNIVSSAYDGTNFIDATQFRTTTTGTVGTGNVSAFTDLQTSNTGTLSTAQTWFQDQTIAFPHYTTNGVTTFNSGTGLIGVATQGRGIGFSSNTLSLDTTQNYTLTKGLSFASTSVGWKNDNQTDVTTNYERAVGQWQSNVYTIGNYSAGSGTARNLMLGVQRSSGTTTLSSTTAFTMKPNPSTAVGIFDFNSGNLGTAGEIFSLTGTSTLSSGVHNQISIQNTITQTSSAGWRGLYVSPFFNTVGSGVEELAHFGVNTAGGNGGNDTARVVIKRNGDLIMFGPTGLNTNSVTVRAPSSFTSYILPLPATQGAAATYLTGAGSSAMTWSTASQIVAGLIVGTPTIVAGIGAGTSPTVSVTTNGKGLQVTVTTGTLPTGTNATIATVTLANALSYTPSPVFSPASANTALLSGASMVYMTSTGTANVTITSGTTALTAATTYVWNIAL